MPLLMLSLIGCGGPASVLIHGASMGLGAKARADQRERDFQRRYKEKCLWAEYNALKLTQNAINNNKPVDALAYLQVVGAISDYDTGALQSQLDATVTPAQREEAARQFQQHTEENLHSCYYVR